MYTELIKIAENGLNGNSEKVRAYMELFVSKYYPSEEKPRGLLTFEERIAFNFKFFLLGEEQDHNVTLDSVLKH